MKRFAVVLLVLSLAMIPMVAFSQTEPPFVPGGPITTGTVSASTTTCSDCQEVRNELVNTRNQLNAKIDLLGAKIEQDRQEINKLKTKTKKH